MWVHVGACWRRGTEILVPAHELYRSVVAFFFLTFKDSLLCHMFFAQNIVNNVSLYLVMFTHFHAKINLFANNLCSWQAMDSPSRNKYTSLTWHWPTFIVE